MSTAEELRDALEYMVWQHAYRIVKDGRLALSTGGLSANEYAFDVLGWDDPHFVGPEGLKCEVVGCPEWATGGNAESGRYLRLCHEHYRVTDPKVEPWAIEREAQRDPATGRLP